MIVGLRSMISCTCAHSSGGIIASWQPSHNRPAKYKQSNCTNCTPQTTKYLRERSGKPYFDQLHQKTYKQNTFPGKARHGVELKPK